VNNEKRTVNREQCTENSVQFTENGEQGRMAIMINYKWLTTND